MVSPDEIGGVRPLVRHRLLDQERGPARLQRQPLFQQERRPHHAGPELDRDSAGGLLHDPPGPRHLAGLAVHPQLGSPIGAAGSRVGKQLLPAPEVVIEEGRSRVGRVLDGGCGISHSPRGLPEHVGPAGAVTEREDVRPFPHQDGHLQAPVLQDQGLDPADAGFGDPARSHAGNSPVSTKCSNSFRSIPAIPSRRTFRLEALKSSPSAAEASATNPSMSGVATPR